MRPLVAAFLHGPHALPSLRRPGRSWRGPLLSGLAVPWLALAGVVARGETPVATLTTAAEIRALSPVDASRALAVRLNGVVITINWAPSAIVLMDETEGIYVRTPAAVARNLKPGDWVELDGVTAPGDFAPIALAHDLRLLGAKPVPPPLPTTLGDIASGGFDARWVEVEGIVRNCTASTDAPAGPEAAGSAASIPRAAGPADPSGFSVMTLAWGNERLRIRVHAPVDPAALVDARVRVQGVCFNVHNANRQFVSANLQAPSPDAITVLAAPPPDPFALPVQRASELLQFNRAGFSGHRVHVRGIVTRQEVGNALWIRDGERGLSVVSNQAGRIAPGDEVDIAGFVDPGSYSPSLVDAVFRRVASGAPPAPIRIDRFADAIAHESDLIEVDAQLTDMISTPEGRILTLGWEDAFVQAVLPRPAAGGSPPAWEVGSRIRIRGICALAPTGYAPETGLWVAESFRLLLRDAADVDVLRGAPWLNTKRALQLVGACAGGLLIGAVWLGVVSRRHMAQREAERRTAEAEFAAILRERNRMAREIHDTLAQGLNAVSMQLELARNQAGKNPEGVLQHVETAHAIVRSCSAEARESIWDMRSHVLERTDLAGALEGVLRQLSEGLPVETRFEAKGKARRLAPKVENNLLRIGQEAISNAIKHARATRIRLCLDFEPDIVRLRVADDGCGFDVAGSVRAGSHFGLAGMKERVEQMQARLEVESSPGQGTEVTVEVPHAA